ncbi:MAG: phosphate/phosphite/phosphonate ABC transporter substrate-binding protein [Puniceicoccaceae bacterium]|nr:MAG: phosphate/phosphite/phosphonate ABC transporter substrate-binding protein [Puniceicoccaceae bacterium]
MRPALFTLLVALVVTAAGTALPAREPPPLGNLSSLVFALKPDKDPEAMLQERRNLAEFLRQETGLRTDVIVPLSAAVIVQGLHNGTIDLAFVSSTDSVQARRQGAGEVLLAGEIDGQTWYQSYWLSLADKPYASVEDLRGRRIAFSSRSSTSGYIIPLWDLRERGLINHRNDVESFFGPGNVIFGTGYVSAVERVLQGDAEAAAVSDYVLDRDKHLSADQRARLKKVAAQGPVPTHVIVVRAGLPEEARAELRRILLSLNEAGNTGLRDRLFTGRLIEVDPAVHLKSIADALEFARP